MSDGMRVEIRGDLVLLIGADGFMRQMWKITGGSIRTRRTWGGSWERRLSARDILMLRDDVRQALVRCWSSDSGTESPAASPPPGTEET